MNYYAGFATRIASSFFPQAVPVPQLQPLDARKIFYASDEEAWAAFLTWEDAKVQEREAKTVNAARRRMKYDIYDPSTWPPYLWPAKPAYDAYDPSTWPPYVWPAEPAAVRCKKPYDAHLASLLAAPVAPPPKPSAATALKGKLSNLNFSIPSQPSATKKPSLFGDDDLDLFGDEDDEVESGCPYPESDEDEGDGDYGTDDDDFGDFIAPASKPSKTGCPALGDGHRRLFLRN